MKSYKTLIAGLILTTSLMASPRVSVSEFKDETAHWNSGCKKYEWGAYYMGQLKSALERELSKKNVRILERQNINKMYIDEYKMENLNEGSKQKTKQFLAAEYAVIGALTEMGVCEEESDSGVSLGNVVSLLGGPHTELDVDAKLSVSRTKMIAKVVSVRTGEVIKSFESEASDTDTGIGGTAKVMGIGGHHNKRTNKPYEKIANAALKDLAEQIAEFINSKS